jgi:hypothetical protein
MSAPSSERFRVAVPCRAPRDPMTSDAAVRHCAHCDRDVYRLAALPQATVDMLLRAVRAGERMCARVSVRFDGTAITAAGDPEEAPNPFPDELEGELLPDDEWPAPTPWPATAPGPEPGSGPQGRAGGSQV